ncbi:hypothetical protein [Brumimicrobium oceani]|uniref:Uncharacterized protein n=1 Tax=Brumimicrobium oceani TaxID=2100725 RepID=A0A2U2X372_9FLAO|nr:hypothetical protein [Brumimicrobium oceani]PWH82235.1 hypothetical protein DIT68_14115 [Brumimicrobium oceani]
MDKYTGYYTGTVSTDSIPDTKLDTTISMKAELFLNPDSTYRMTWHIQIKPDCNFATFWKNTGKWLASDKVLFFTLDEDEEFLSNKNGTIGYPIAFARSRNPAYNLKRRALHRYLKFEEKYPEYKYELMIEEDNSIWFGAGWDCIESVWTNNPIVKVKSY